MEFRHQTAYKQATEAIAQCNLHLLTVRNTIQDMKTPWMNLDNAQREKSLTHTDHVCFMHLLTCRQDMTNPEKETRCLFPRCTPPFTRMHPQYPASHQPASPSHRRRQASGSLSFLLPRCVNAASPSADSPPPFSENSTMSHSMLVCPSRDLLVP